MKNDKKINIKKQINNFSEELIDNLLNTPDKEILKEVEEEYGDSAYIANQMREKIEKCRIKARKK